MNIVIVGGGFAGVKTALELANKRSLKITLISQGADFEYHGALYRSATGHSPLEVVIRLGEIFSHAKNVNVVIDKIVSINTSQRCISGETGQMWQYDKLVLAMGNERNYFGIPGLEEHAFSMYTIHDAMMLRNELVKLFTLPERSQVKVIVIGAGPSGVELAGEMQNFANIVAERYQYGAKKVDVDLIEGSDRVLPILNQRVSRVALQRLEKVGVDVLLQKKVIECSEGKVVLESETREADIIIWTAGSKSVGFFAQYPDVFELERGKVKVNEYLQVPKYEDIYVLGDNALTQYSGMAQTAINDALFAAKHIQMEAHGKKRMKAYRPKHPIYVVPIGGKWAVVQESRKVRSGRYGWSVRRKADLYIFKNFEPFKQAYKTWRKGNRLAQF